MIQEIVRFAVLGLGAGSIYAMTALGVVVVYRGSGVLNFAHGSIGMLGAFVFYDMRSAGWPTVLCWFVAVGFGAVVGLLTHVLVMRPMRTATPLSRLVATLGLLSVCLASGSALFGDEPRLITKLLPTDRVELGADIAIGRDRLILLVIAVAITVALSLLTSRTSFGRSTEAVAEHRRSSAAQGISPDVVAAANWAIGSALGVVAAVLVVNIAGLSVTGLTTLIVFALAAALVGGMRSFPLTLAGGLLIGVLQSEVDWLRVHLSDVWARPVGLDGWAQSVPFVVIIGVLVLRGRALPVRGDERAEPPAIGAGVIAWRRVVAAIAAVLLVLTWLLPSDLVGALTTSACFALVALSLVVVTGMGGQLSLAQMSLAGMGGWIAATLASRHGVGFVPAAMIGVLGAIPVGVLVGLPSLRTRGVNLAVATLGLALVLEAQLLGNGHRTGGLQGLPLRAPNAFGIDLDPVRHPERYAVLTVVCCVLVALCVANLRRGRAGRQLVAVRTNERAAASLGISVMGAKVYAFGLAAAIAAVGGVLIVFRQPTAVFFPTFQVFQSIYLVVYGVIGGIGFVTGAVIAGLNAPGGYAIAQLNAWTGILDSGEAVQILLGVALLVTLRMRPDGIAGHLARRSTERQRSGRSKPWPRRAVTVRPERSVVAPVGLSIRSLSVRFGGVMAVDDVSLDVAPGTVVGLIGPNGAGKTTVVDAVTGFVRARGQVLLGDRDIADLSPRRRAAAGLGRSFQGLELFDTMTVRENLLAASDRATGRHFLTDLVRPGRAELGPHALAVVHQMGLEDTLDLTPDALPYGRRRLVALARAVAAAPSVLLLDEPAAGLDDAETARLGALVRTLATEWGMAILLIEHDVSLVMSVCDSVCVLDQGCNLTTGTPTDVLDDPRVRTAYLGAPALAATESGAEAIDADTDERPSSTDTTSDDAQQPARSPVGTGPVLLAASGITVGYGDLAAVRSLDLEVRAGEIIALLGPNGAGKTTTLLALAGELPLIDGSIERFGTSGHVPLHRLVRRGLGFIADDRSIISGLSTRSNLRLGEHDLPAALAVFPELERLLDRRAGLLSGGEQQMLSVARALARGPRLLLVDELSTGLAPLIVARLLAALRAAADRGVAVVIVEQHTAEILRVADRVVVVQRGRAGRMYDVDEVTNDPGLLSSAYLSTAEATR